MIPERPDEMYDEDTAKQTRQEAREKARDGARRAEVISAAIQRALPLAMVESDARRLELMTGFAEDMLEFVGGELVADEMCIWHDVKPLFEESRGELLEKFKGLSQPDQIVFLMMTLLRSLMKRLGPDSETIAQWCAYLGIEGKTEDLGRQDAGAPGEAAAEATSHDYESCPRCGETTFPTLQARFDHVAECGESEPPPPPPAPVKKVPRKKAAGKKAAKKRAARKAGKGK
jgi:hypothetical protein